MIKTKQKDRARWWKERVGDSTSLALDEVRAAVSWLEGVATEELSSGERRAILAASRRFYMVLRPVAEKYLWLVELERF